VADSGSAEITRIDVRTDKTSSVSFPGAPAWTAWAGDRVWIGSSPDGNIVELDARTAKIVRTTKVGAALNDGDVLDGAVWFPAKGGALYRLDEHTNKLTGPFALGANNPFVAAGYGGKLWIADFGGTQTLVVDPQRLPGG
jgi:streptogramin lyase